MKKHLFLNWKSYLTIEQSVDLAHKIAHGFCNGDDCKAVILPNMAALQQVAHVYPHIGLQNIFPYEAGAYTGEVTFNIAAEVNAKYCLVGHSERRVYGGETDEEVHAKARFLLEHMITPIICVGESAEEHDYGKRDEVLKRQLDICCDGLDSSKYIIAYEPVWAISGFGSSKNAELDDIISAHTCISSHVGSRELPILYGGSVHAAIDQAFLDAPEIHGFLIGSMGTKFEELKVLLDRI